MKTMPSPHATAAAVVFSITFAAAANPTGGTVQSGAATFNTSGSTLTVHAANNTFINWQTFNIAAGEHTVFNQPSAASIVWNRVNDPNPSQIYGSLQANGVVVLLNSSGFYFGPHSFVSAAGLVVSTANCAPPQNTGGAWTFNGPPPLASIVNYGQIKIGNGGDCYLIADKVENHGDIEAPGGNIGLAAGQTVTLSERPDGRGMTMQVTLPQGSVDNHGNIVADGGTIALNAQVVNQGGFIQANSVKDDHGVIELVASDSLNLESGSQISASGDASAAGSAGGTVTLKSGNTFSDADGSQITVTGGANGGNGGNVEVSAPTIESLNTAMDSSAQAGSQAGTLLLDPTTINLGTSGSGTVPANGTVASGSAPTTLNLNVNTAFANKNFSNIKLQATGTINLLAGTIWDLSGSTGQSSGQLTLEAGGNINLNDGSQIVDGNNWSVNLMAGYNFTLNTIKQGTGSILFNGSGSIQTAAGAVNLSAGKGITLGSGAIQSASGPITLESGTGVGSGITLGDGSQISDGGNGSITVDAGYNFSQGKVVTGGGSLLLNGSSFIQTSAGDINLAASDNITVNSGYVVTKGGGNINAHALTGSIDSGSDAQGYNFVLQAGSLANAYNVNQGLGGIGTADGGNVTLMAGLDVTSVLPETGNNYEYDGDTSVQDANRAETQTAGIGAYGRGKAGNVTVVAGGDVVGNYLVADGTGSIYAGAKMDANWNPIATGPGYLLGTTGNAGNGTTLLALNLISGGWNVAAGQNIFLQEVRNPNGTFNTQGSAAVQHLFDYAPTDYVNLTAGNEVQLGAPTYPRLDPSGGLKVPPIYPGILNINAGAGGVVLDGTGKSGSTFAQLILYPSLFGSLSINTTGGGSLVSGISAVNQIEQTFDIIVSDSSADQATSGTTFGINDHASSPIHLGHETPVKLNISGDMSLVELDSPESAQINVVGNMYNSSFQGMNLSAADSTITVGAAAKKNMETSGILSAASDGGLHVGGNITDSSAYTSVDLSQYAGAGAPDLSVLAYALPPNGFPDGATLANSFFYNPTTKVLTYKYIPFDGKTVKDTTAQILAGLENLTVQVVINGVPQWQDARHTIPRTTTVSVLNSTAAVALFKQFNADLQNARLNHVDNLHVNNLDETGGDNGPPNGVDGFVIGGGGTLKITADNMDLGNSPGVNSVGVGFYTGPTGGYPLAQLFTTGADLDVNLSGDLTMFSSAIATLNGSNLKLNVGGTLNASSPNFTVNTDNPRGIYTTGRGSCAVIVGNDININGSRIAAYDGGDLTVESLHGNVNIGNGGNGTVTVNAYFVNPVTRSVFFDPLPISGSGIIAATFPDDKSAVVGDVLVEAPNGNIEAQAGGIIQYSLNHSDSSHSTVEVLAGEELEDAHGNPVYADDLSAGKPVEISANHDINASGYGVIAENAILRATGSVQGTIFSANGIDLVAPQVSNLQAIGKTLNITANSYGGGVTLIGSESVTTSGGAAGADILSANANGGGNSFAAGTAANATSAAASAQSVADATKAATQTSDTGSDDQNNKKKNVTLAQKVSRVTVILPGKY